MHFPGGSAGKESACNAGDLGSISGLGRSAGEGNSSPLQYSGLESSMGTVDHGVAKSQTRLSDFTSLLHSIFQQIWKTQQWLQDWKRSVFIPIPEKGNAKECSNYCAVALISHARKEMLKILQARLQQYMNHELPDVQAGLRKGRGTRDQTANICWVIEKARGFQKKIFLVMRSLRIHSLNNSHL